MRYLYVMLAVCLVVAVMVTVAHSGNRTDDPIGVSVSPQTLILNADQGGRITVHTDIPYSDVDKLSLDLSGVPVESTGIDATGCLVAMFSETAVKSIVSVPSATLTLSGLTVDGEFFSGSDTVQVTVRRR